MELMTDFFVLSLLVLFYSFAWVYIPSYALPFFLCLIISNLLYYVYTQISLKWTLFHKCLNLLSGCRKKVILVSFERIKTSVVIDTRSWLNSLYARKRFIILVWYMLCLAHSVFLAMCPVYVFRQDVSMQEGKFFSSSFFHCSLSGWKFYLNLSSLETLAILVFCPCFIIFSVFS